MQIQFVQTAGILAILGSLIYAIGDVLLLAGKASLDDYPKLRTYAKLLSSAERMVALSPYRMMIGALLGVFATPLMLAGFWQVSQGLQGANQTLVLTTTFLFGIAAVFGTFVHGSFYYMGEYVHALNNVDDFSQVVIAGMINRHRKLLIITYAPIMILIVIASILFSIVVASGDTAFSAWMVAVNPVTLTITWLALKRILPQFVRDWTEGAGFNIAYLAFFICTTSSLW
jgi:hypothetical protein